MRAFRSCAGLAIAVALAACAVLPTADEPARAPDFDLVGRVAVHFDGRAFSSSIRWTHGAALDEIWLMTPTGQALARVTGGADGATFTGADGGEYQAGDIESLMRRAMGWELPVSRLAWWIQGGIVPGGLIGEVLRDADGRLLRLKQDGWNVTLTHPAGTRQGQLPARVDLADDKHRIRLVIDRWRQDFAGTGPAKSLSTTPSNSK